MEFSLKPLRGYMAEERMSIRDVAVRCGLSIATVNRMFNTNRFTSDMILKICEGLNIGIGDVVRLENYGEQVPLVTKPNPYINEEMSAEDVVNEQLQLFITQNCAIADDNITDDRFSEFYREGFYDCAEKISKFKLIL